MRFQDDEYLDGLRQVGDPEADELAAGLFRQHSNLDEGDIVRLVVQQIGLGPSPDGDGDGDPTQEWLLDTPPLPEWVDPDLVRRGQGFFADWPLPVATALFCVSLPAAYAAADGAHVLALTSDLATHNLTRRVAETGRMLFDVMDFGRRDPAGLEPGTQGYLTIRGVRLLHAVVRQSLQAVHPGRERWDPAWGVPVNQEDLLGTLCSFTVAVFEGLDRLGIPYDSASADAYLHTWCLVGHLIGIRPELLPLDRAEARVLADKIAERHHGSSVAGRRLMTALLSEMETAMPLGLQKLPRTLVRHQLPAEIADLLEVPAPAWWHPAVRLVSEVGPVLRRVPGGVRLVQAPSALLGRCLLRRLVDTELNGTQPAFRIDPAAVRRLAIGTSPLRRSLRRRRHRIRRARAVVSSPVAGGR